MTAAEWLSLLLGVLLGGCVLVAVVFVTRVVQYERRHHRLANRRFKRRYRMANSTTQFVRRPRPCPAGTGPAPVVPATPPPSRRAA